MYTGNGYINLYLCAYCTLVYMDLYSRFLYTCMRIYTRTRNAHVRAHADAHAHTHTHSCMSRGDNYRNLCSYVYIHVYMYMYTCMGWLPLVGSLEL